MWARDREGLLHLRDPVSIPAKELAALLTVAFTPSEQMSVKYTSAQRWNLY